MNVNIPSLPKRVQAIHQPRFAEGTVPGEMIGVVDRMAMVAAVVGEPLAPATPESEDSYNALAAWRNGYNKQLDSAEHLPPANNQDRTI